MDINSIFKPTINETSNPSQPLQPTNPTNKQKGETYRHWGLKVCAIVNGSCYALAPYLQNAYNSSKQAQTDDAIKQEEYRRNLRCQIEQKNNTIDVLNVNLDKCKQKQIDKKEAVARLNAEKADLRNGAYKVNKAAKMKLILGIVILVPLTFYLFLFYSSTFYSAFFKDFGSSDSILNSMFDAEALSKALATSVTELCFVLCAPIIFMGLGFCLHFFTVQKSWTKYFKIAAVLIITFIFDAILAYMIGKHLHEMEVIIGTKPLGSPYGLAEAAADINTWAVIFCGFIVYIIWGIVFDMSMTAYDQLDLNTINIKAIEDRIKLLNSEIDKECQEEQTLNAEIATHRNEIAGLTAKINNETIIDMAAIRQDMTEFFAGWVAQMNVLSIGDTEQHQANQIFNNTLASLLN